MTIFLFIYFALLVVKYTTILNINNKSKYKQLIDSISKKKNLIACCLLICYKI